MQPDSSWQAACMANWRLRWFCCCGGGHVVQIGICRPHSTCPRAPIQKKRNSLGRGVANRVCVLATGAFCDHQWVCRVFSFPRKFAALISTVEGRLDCVVNCSVSLTSQGKGFFVMEVQCILRIKRRVRIYSEPTNMPEGNILILINKLDSLFMSSHRGG